jgi:hypothetical protein
MDRLSDANMDQDLSDMINLHLIAQGRCTMKDCTPSHSLYSHVSLAINNLGWDCLVEGRIPQILIDTVQPMLCQYNPGGSVDLWCAKFIKSLISITHKQWLYRNSNMHHVIDGLPSRQQQELAARIHRLLETKRTSLLERHKHFIDVDFMKLGSGTTIAHQVWVANVKMAISVAKILHGNFCMQETIQLLHTPPVKLSSHLPYRQTPICPPPKQTGPTTLKQSGAMIQRNSASFARLSKASYYYSRTHRSTPPISEQTSHRPAFIRQPRNVRNKTQWQAQLLVPYNKDLQPYDKICAHLHRLHTRMKTKVNQD